MKYPQTEFGRDVAMMVLCLAGINTIDLYNLRKQDYRNGIIHYQRAKTKKFRADGAYMEMRVPAIIQPLFEKYMNTAKDDERLFKFLSAHDYIGQFLRQCQQWDKAIYARLWECQRKSGIRLTRSGIHGEQ